MDTSEYFAETTFGKRIMIRQCFFLFSGVPENTSIGLKLIHVKPVLEALEVTEPESAFVKLQRGV